MPIHLKENVERDCYYVVLGKMQKADFQDALARVKATTGRRPNPNGPDGKFVWEFPRNPDTALRLMTTLQPIADPSIETAVKHHAAEVSTQLITTIGDDAEVRFPGAEGLFPYQRAAIHRIAEQPRILLADDMGLGKTVESVAAVEEYYLTHPPQPDAEPGPTLVICPKAVRGTWQDTFATGPVDRDGNQIIPEWVPQQAKIIDARTPAKRVEQIKDAAYTDFPIIVNWEAFWREPVLPALGKINWGAIIADEAHRAKNRKSKQSKGLRRLHAPVQIAATGTPVMNSPDELWALLAWLYPEAYTSFWAFHNSYVDEYTVGAFNRRVMVGVKNPDDLRFELADKMIRRRKTDVLKDLPEKMPTQIIEVEMSPAHRRLYKEAEKALFIDASEYVEARVEEELADLQPVMRTNKKAMIEKLTEEIADMPMDRLTALIPNAAARIAKLRQITLAAKVPVADELIREEPETPVVAFTWHKDGARQLAEQLAGGRPRMQIGTIVGDDDATPIEKAFQAGELDHVVATIAKGGTGLTLTRSSNPLLLEEDWTPAITDQAIDRTHRIGQADPVTPRLLRCKNTVDDGRVASRNTFKRAVMAQVHGA